MSDLGQEEPNSEGIAAIRAALANGEAVDDIGEADPFELKCARFAQNDYGNGQRLRERYGRDLLFVKDVGWHAWVDTHWSAKDGDRHRR